MYKTVGIIVLSVYIAVLGIFGAAEYFYQTGNAQTAIALNPFVSEYRLALFQQSNPKDINSIKEAIRLEPLKASYHMYYALELLRDYNKRTRASDQIAFREIARAYELKPYSAIYRQIYEQYAKPYLGR